MSQSENNGSSNEIAWITHYRDLTGVTESQARSIYMYVGCRETRSVEDGAARATAYSESGITFLASR